MLIKLNIIVELLLLNDNIMVQFGFGKVEHYNDNECKRRSRWVAFNFLGGISIEIILNALITVGCVAFLVCQNVVMVLICINLLI